MKIKLALIILVAILLFGNQTAAAPQSTGYNIKLNDPCVDDPTCRNIVSPAPSPEIIESTPPNIFGK